MNTSAAKPKPDTITIRTEGRLQFHLIFSKSACACNVYLCFDFCLHCACFKVAEHSFVAVSDNSHDSCVLHWTNEHGGANSNGTQKTISQNLLINIL